MCLSASLCSLQEILSNFLIIYISKKRKDSYDTCTIYIMVATSIAGTAEAGTGSEFGETEARWWASASASARTLTRYTDANIAPRRK